VLQGRDPRTLTEDIIRHLRDCFLALMAPELVQLPVQREEEVSSQATRLGAASIVRAMERLGEMLVEMRHAPDPRLLLEVALVQLTHDAAGADLHILMSRLERLEQTVAAGAIDAATTAKAVPIPLPGAPPSAVVPSATLRQRRRLPVHRPHHRHRPAPILRSPAATSPHLHRRRRPPRRPRPTTVRFLRCSRRRFVLRCAA
jgi:DNA polymerase-3 subunit gamma/tau